MNKEGMSIVFGSLAFALLIGLFFSMSGIYEKYETESGSVLTDEGFLFEGFVVEKKDYQYLISSYGKPADFALVSKENNDFVVGDQVNVWDESEPFDSNEPTIEEDDVDFDPYRVEETEFVAGLDPSVVYEAIANQQGDQRQHIEYVHKTDDEWSFVFSSNGFTDR